MKIAISSDDKNLQSRVDQRFGRCPYFLIAEIDEENKIKSSEAITNEGAIQGHGAGIKAAEQIGELEVSVVITGQVGPNATKILKELGIKTYSASGVIAEALADFAEGKLEKITEVAEPHSDDKE